MSSPSTSIESRPADTPLRKLVPWLPLLLAVPLVAWALLGGGSPEPDGGATSDGAVAAPPSELPQPLPPTPARVPLRFVDDTGQPVRQTVFFLTWEPAEADLREDVRLQWGFHRADDDGVYAVDPAPRGARLSIEIIDPELQAKTQVLDAGVEAGEIVVTRLTADEKARLKAIDAEIAKPETQADKPRLKALRDEQTRIRRGQG